MKILPVGAEVFLAGGGTDRHDKTDSHFPQLRERAQKCIKTYYILAVFLKHLRVRVRGHTWHNP
jgi:hypothetical protein